MHTVLRSKTREVVIGPDKPFCIIGERINPTGRKAFAAQLRERDLSQVLVDVQEQVTAGAHVLDVNMGVPLTDEAELLASAVRLVQEHCDLPLCIDSSVVEALEAGLDAYQGKALVNSVTAEDDRLELILPLVKRHGAAVIALANDETGIPATAQERIDLTGKILRVATEEYGIPAEDIVIDPLAMTVGADPTAVNVTLETIRGIRDQYDLNMSLGASNVSFGLPARHALNAAFIPLAAAAGLTSAIMDARTPQIVEAARASDILLGKDEWGSNWIGHHRAAVASRGGGVTAVEPTDAGVGAPARVRLRFEPSGVEVRVPPGVTLFDAASWNGVAIDSTCGAHGTCKKCRVRVDVGDLPVTKIDARVFTPDELREGWRLACRAQAVSDHVVDVPPLATRPKAATVGVGRQVILRPAVVKRYLELDEPTLHDQRSDAERVTDALEDLGPSIGLRVLRELPRALRSADWKVTAVVVDDVLIAIEPGDTTARNFAIAFDLGTTTVVATLLDLATGTPVAVRSMLNRQQPFGADVITRISATMLDPEALGRLCGLARSTLDELAQEVCEAGEVEPHEVYEIALAGNATMVELALGIDPEPLGVAPFIPVARVLPDVDASELGVHVNPAAPATILPALGAYVGGDIVAGLLASGLERDGRLRLFIDVGTNCEIALGSRDRLLSTAAPAGPAFEAAQIRCGMRAAPGAIETVRIGDDGVVLGVIGDEEPVGVCGSGLVDACSELVRVGLLDGSGRLLDRDTAAERVPALADRLAVLESGERVFLLVPGPDGGTDGGVFLGQRDVRELQFAKAAIATGWRLLCEELGVDARDIQQVLLAGSFGSYLSPGSAVRIGLVPALPVTRIVSAGNVAGEGAKMVLLSVRERQGARALLDQIEYVELSDRSDFNDRFVTELAFPDPEVRRR